MRNDRNYSDNRIENVNNASLNQRGTRSRLSHRERNLLFTHYGNSTLTENIAQFQTITKQEAYQRGELNRPPTPGTEQDNFILDPPLLQSQRDASHLTQTPTNTHLEAAQHQDQQSNQEDTPSDLQSSQRDSLDQLNNMDAQVSQKITEFITNIFNPVCNPRATTADIHEEILDLITKNQYRGTKNKLLQLGQHFIEKTESIHKISLCVKNSVLRSKNNKIERITIDETDILTDKEKELGNLMITFIFKDEKDNTEKNRARSYLLSYTEYNKNRNKVRKK